MRAFGTMKLAVMLSCATGFLSSPLLQAEQNDLIANGKPMVIPRFIDKAKKNKNWKVAFATAEQGQIVFMNISPMTNPANEIGEEVHPFDQFILVIEGRAKAILDGKPSYINADDLIFVPSGTVHNVINLNRNEPLKIISFYSENDMPKGDIYKKKSDQPEEDELGFVE